MSEEASRRDLLKGAAAAIAVAGVAFASAPKVEAVETPEILQLHKIVCECGALLGTSEKPQPSGSVKCHVCHAVANAAYAKQHASDKAAVLTKTPTLVQALAVRWSTGWGDLAPGVREGWQQVIDEGGAVT